MVTTGKASDQCQPPYKIYIQYWSILELFVQECWKINSNNKLLSQFLCLIWSQWIPLAFLNTLNTALRCEVVSITLWHTITFYIKSSRNIWKVNCSQILLLWHSVTTREQSLTTNVPMLKSLASHLVAEELLGPGDKMIPRSPEELKVWAIEVAITTLFKSASLCLNLCVLKVTTVILPPLAIFIPYQVG